MGVTKLWLYLRPAPRDGTHTWPCFYPEHKPIARHVICPQKEHTTLILLKDIVLTDSEWLMAILRDQCISQTSWERCLLCSTWWWTQRLLPNWPTCRGYETEEYSVLNGVFIAHSLLSKLKADGRRRAGKILRAWLGGWLQGKSKLWTQPGSGINELTVAYTSILLYTHDPIRLKPDKISMDRGSGMESQL